MALYIYRVERKTFFAFNFFGLYRKNTLGTQKPLGHHKIIFRCFLTEKPSITAHPRGDIVTEGENITLSCDAIGSPVLTISWTINGSPVNTSDNSRISFSTNKTQLTITNASRIDSGEYQCMAENRVGSDTSDVAKLDIHCKNSILIPVMGLYLYFNILNRFLVLEEHLKFTGHS